MKKVIFVILAWLFLHVGICGARQLTPLAWPEQTPLYILEAGDSPFLVDSVFVVEQDHILIIEPGVQILFEAGAGLAVKGKIRAEGRRGKKIEFLARDKRFPWSGIFFNNADKINQLSYCVISNAGGIDPHADILELTGSVGGGISCINSSIKIEYCIISGNTADKGGAIFAQNSELFLQGNIIAKNNAMEGGALYAYDVKAILIGNKIEKNKSSNIAGAVLSFDSDLELYRNRIVSNEAGFEGGLFQENSQILYKFNNISRNKGKKAETEFLSEIIPARPGLKKELSVQPAALSPQEKMQPSKTPAQIKQEIIESLAAVNGQAFLPRKYSPYRIDRSIVVSREGTLEIQPGTVLEFASSAGMLVEGRLIARGKKTRKIYFQGADGKQFWKNIIFINSHHDNNIEWCVVGRGNGQTVSDLQGDAFIAGGGIAAIDSNVSVSYTSFECNTAEYGGAIFGENAVLLIDRCSFQKNKAEKDGGAVYVRISSATITRNDFFENTAVRDGGVMYLYQTESEIIENNMYQNTVPRMSGIIFCRGSRPKIRNNQILKNTGRRIVVNPESAEVLKRTLAIK